MIGPVTASSSKACATCGAPLGKAERICPACGAPVGSSAILDRGGDDWAHAFARLREITRGEFEIQREIGRGGMAAVYLAREIALDRRVAIKVMAPRLTTDRDLVSRFRQEAVTVAGLVHPNIVTIHAVRHTDDLDFFVMQFVEGRSLDRVVHGHGALPVPIVRALVFMIGSALGYAHRRGVVHRDVKPANVLLDGDGHARVTDFGIAKVLGATHRITKTGMLIGTPSYISPEQCYAQPISAAADQYALGIVTYELLTGHPPFTGSPFTVMQAHTERPIPPIREIRADIPPDFEAALLRMLEKDPAKRWPTMQHALAALEARPLAEGDPMRDALARLALPDSVLRSDELLALPRLVAAAPGAPSPYVAGIAILAAPAELPVGATITLSAAPRNAAGDTMPGVYVEWTTSAAAIAVVDRDSGVVRAVAPGTATITVSAEGVRASVELRVVPKRTVELTIVTPQTPLHVGDRIQLVVATVDHVGEPIGERVRWSCATPQIATVSEDGVLTAVAPGTALVWAEANGVRATAHLPITPARVAAIRLGTIPTTIEVGAQLSVGATPVDVDGHTIADAQAVWLSSDPEIAAVSAAGVVTAKAPGQAIIVCSCESETTAIDLTVVPMTVAAVRIERPDGARIGEPFKLHAEALSKHGRRVPAPMEFQSTAPDIASVDEHGVVTPRALGEVTIFARTSGAQGMVSFYVTAEATQLKWRPPHSRRALRRQLIGGIGALTLVVFLVLVIGASLGDDPQEEVRQSGDVQPVVAPPSAPAPVAEPSAIVGLPASIAPGDTFTVQVTGVSNAAWSSSDSAVATIDRATGRVRALAYGAAELIASTGGDSVRIPLRVAPPAGMVVRIAPTATMQVGDQRRLALEVSPRGLPIPDATWESRAPSLLQVAATGRARALGEGTVYVIARWQGGADSALVTVQGVPIARIELAPSRLRLEPGDSARVTARLLDARGNAIAGREVTWSTTNREAVSVSADGVIRALAPAAAPVRVTARAGAAREEMIVEVHESPREIARRVARVAEEFTNLVRTHDTARVRTLFSPDDPGLGALVDRMSQPRVEFRFTTQPQPAVTDSSVVIEVRIRATIPKRFRDEVRNGVFAVSMRRDGGTWRAAGVTTVSTFR